MDKQKLLDKIEKSTNVEEIQDLRQQYEEERAKEEKLEEERKLLKNDVKDLKDDEEGTVIAKPEKNTHEERGIALKEGKMVTVDNDEKRTTTVSSGSLLVEKKYKRDIDEAFEGVSALIDNVSSIQLDGGDSYSVAFEKEYSEGDYTEEANDYADTDVQVDYVETGRAKITAYSEITKEAKKLPNINYEDLVVRRVTDAIRKKVSAQIISGAGTSNTITGIYNADTKVMNGDSDIEISEIDADTLTDIVFSYGGDEAVETEETLILNKADLQAFAKVKDADGKPVYKVTRNHQTGTIAYVDGGLDVPYVISSACNSIENATEGDYTMVYGSLSSYEMPVFSPLTIEESNDYKFKQGIIAYRGEVICGGTVSKYNGFVRVKKGAERV